MQCCKCGKELPEQARFCRYCGAEQTAPAPAATSPAPPTAVKHCSNCNRELPPHAAFCSSCGTPGHGPAPTTHAPAVVAATTTTASSPSAPVASVTPPKTAPEAEQAAPPPPRSNTPLIAALAVVLSLALGGVGYWLGQGKSETGNALPTEVAPPKAEPAAQVAPTAAGTTNGASVTGQGPQEPPAGNRPDQENRPSEKPAHESASHQSGPRQPASGVASAPAKALPAARPAASSESSQPAPARPTPPKGPRNVKELCADRPNFISRNQCEYRFCTRPEWIRSSYCVELNTRSKAPPPGF